MKLLNDEIIHYKSKGDGATVIVERTELIRCKDCKHFRAEASVNIFFIHYEGKCGLHNNPFEDLRPSDYCSYGERKEQEHE